MYGKSENFKRVFKKNQKEMLELRKTINALRKKKSKRSIRRKDQQIKKQGSGSHPIRRVKKKKNKNMKKSEDGLRNLYKDNIK